MEVIGGLLKKLGCPTNKYYNKNWLGLPTQLVRKMLSESGGALTSTLERMLSYKKVAFRFSKNLQLIWPHRLQKRLCVGFNKETGEKLYRPVVKLSK